ncbi:hypothetical protein ACOSP7_025404 [Xanthoceras sorbifolium]
MKQGSCGLVSSSKILVLVLVFTLMKVSGGGDVLSPIKTIVFGPSAACCGRVRVSHFECVCPLVTPKLASLINVNHAINLLKRCGRTVPRHFKCGSLNFP